MTDLEIIKKFYNSTNVEYHEINENGYIYIRPLRSNEVKNETIYVLGYGSIPLKSGEQLYNYIEFSSDGSLASYSDGYEFVDELLIRIDG